MKKLSLLFVLIFPTILQAQEDIATPGINWSKAGGVRIFSSGDIINVNLDLNRSYACTITGSDSDSELGLDFNLVNPSGIVVPGKAIGAQTPPVTVGSSDSNQADNRISVFSTTGGVWKFAVSSAKAGGEEGAFVCRETSLYGNWNTFLNPFNFLEVTNLSYDSIEIIVIIRSFDGATFTANATVAADRRMDLDVHSLVGPAGYGSIKLKHDGPVGALSAFISQYNTDSSGATVMRSSLKLTRRDSID